MLFEIRIKSGLPFIYLNRELANTDLGGVIERENAIDFIFGDDFWNEENGHHVLKLRFKQSLDLDSTLRKLSEQNQIKMDAVTWINLAKICRVFRIATKDESLKEEIEAKFYVSCLESLEEAIDEFNITILMKGVST